MCRSRRSPAIYRTPSPSAILAIRSYGLTADTAYLDTARKSLAEVHKQQQLPPRNFRMSIPNSPSCARTSRRWIPRS